MILSFRKVLADFANRAKPQPRRAPCDEFGGANAEALNKLMDALFKASRGDVYGFLEKTPKTSFIVELHDALLELGYTVKKI